MRQRLKKIKKSRNIQPNPVKNRQKTAEKKDYIEQPSLQERRKGKNYIFRVKPNNKWKTS